MKSKTINVASGTLVRDTYTSSDPRDNSMPSPIKWIFIEDPDVGPIDYLKHISPNKGFDIGDVIYDYVEEHCEHGLVLANDYMLDLRMPVLDTDSLASHFEELVYYLYDNAFMHTKFNEEFRVTDIESSLDLFVYGNEDGHDFIDSHRNMFDHWDASGKII